MPAAFTVEDGTVVANANAYADVAFVDQYFLDRGGKQNTAWAAATVDDKQTAIVRATDYVEKRFQTRWIGARSTDTQALSWPRLYAYDSVGVLHEDSVPLAVKKAIAEYAYRALSYVLLPDGPQPVSESINSNTVSINATGQVLKKRSKVGPIEEEIEYSRTPIIPVGDFSMPAYPAADLLLKPFLKPAANYVYR